MHGSENVKLREMLDKSGGIRYEIASRYGPVLLSRPYSALIEGSSRYGILYASEHKSRNKAETDA
jgi:hypothetical protein